MALDVESGVRLRLSFEQDMRLEYKASSHVVQEIIEKGSILGRNEQKWSTRVSQRVLRVEGDGSAHVITVSEPEGPLPEIQVPGAQVQRQVVYAQMDPRGNMVEVSGMAGGSAYAFPDGPVKTGDSWEATSDVQLPGMPAPTEATTQYVLAGTEQIGEYQCVRIDMRSTEISFEMLLPDGQQKAKVLMENQGSLYFAPQEGILVRMVMKTRSVPHIQDFTFDTNTTITQDLERWESPSRTA